MAHTPAARLSGRRGAAAIESGFREPSVPLSTPSLPRFFAAAEPHRLAVLRALWPAIAGEAVANHTEIVGMQDEVLRVRADSASWLKTVRDLKGTLVLRFQRAAGPLAPRALAFIEGAVAGRVPRRPAKAGPVPVPVADLSEGVRAAAAQVPSEEGRQIYLRAVTAFQARFGSATTRP
jgi:hypothetical protein